jgi:hypothetical protein
MTSARERFDEFVRRADPIPYDELEDFWSTLEPVTIDFMIGEWRGGDLVTGHRGDRFLGDRWWGTTFRTAFDVDPIVYRDDGGATRADTKLMNGAASLWMEKFRGELTATMVYDGMPIHDHFKKVDDDTVAAVTNGKGALDFASGTGRYMYFYLSRL